jgi:hypothetical protein
MKNLKKMKFSDITGMLEADEAKGILGGGPIKYTNDQEAPGEADNIGGNGGFGLTGFGQGGFVSGSANNFSQLGSYGNTSFGGNYSNSGAGTNSGSGTNNLNSSTSNTNYNNDWFVNAQGNLSTTSAIAIDRYFQFIRANNGIVNANQINAFVNNEKTASGQQQNFIQYNIQLPGTRLDNVTVVNYYKGPSTIKQGTVIDNMTLQINLSNGPRSTSTTNTTNSNASWYVMPIHGSSSKPSPLEAALLSKSVYGGKDTVGPDKLFGWKVSNEVKGIKYNDPSSGFKSQLYERITAGKKEYCYVTAGTEPEIGDYAADVLQTAGISLQYKESVDNAKALKALFGDALSFSGHSLGGGMAEANARATGGSAVTINAAGLSYSTALLLGIGFVSDTHSYIMTNDPLNIAQMVIPGLTTAGGQKHYITPTRTSGGHGVNEMAIELGIKSK